MEKNNISEKDVLELGLDIVKTKDIEKLISKSNNDLIKKIDARQVAIGRTVMTSMKSIQCFSTEEIKIEALKSLDIYSKKK